MVGRAEAEVRAELIDLVPILRDCGLSQLQRLCRPCDFRPDPSFQRALARSGTFLFRPPTCDLSLTLVEQRKGNGYSYCGGSFTHSRSHIATLDAGGGHGFRIAQTFGGTSL
jgi:hypothetical protein